MDERLYIAFAKFEEGQREVITFSFRFELLYDLLKTFFFFFVVFLIGNVLRFIIINQIYFLPQA
jgi:hypothetical protein